MPAAAVRQTHKATEPYLEIKCTLTLIYYRLAHGQPAFSKSEVQAQCRYSAGPASRTSAQHCTGTGPPAHAAVIDVRHRRWWWLTSRSALWTDGASWALEKKWQVARPRLRVGSDLSAPHKRLLHHTCMSFTPCRPTAGGMGRRFENIFCVYLRMLDRQVAQLWNLALLY